MKPLGGYTVGVIFIFQYACYYAEFSFSKRILTVHPDSSLKGYYSTIIAKILLNTRLVFPWRE